MLVIKTKLMMPVMVSVNLIHTSLYSCRFTSCTINVKAVMKEKSFLPPKILEVF